VSPTYAGEIAGNTMFTPWYDFGHGLTPFINSIQYKLRGIINGLDEMFNPETDEALFKNYDINSVGEGKAANKQNLQERLGLEQNKRALLIGMVTRLDSQQKGCQLVLGAMDRIMLDNEDVQFVFLGNAADGDWEGKKMESEFRELERRYPQRVVSYIGFEPKIAQQIYAGADTFVVPSLYEPCGLSQMISLKYGTIPIVRETGGLSDTVQDSLEGKGNGFTFKNYDAHALKFAALRAIEGYRDQEGWAILVRRAMDNADFSWDLGPVEEYMKLYFKKT
jgi:starch synthase